MNLDTGLLSNKRLPLPYPLPGLLRLAWCRSLFPGQPTAAGTPRWSALFLLLLLPGLLLYPSLNFRLFEPDEGRYAEIPREMAAHGEWVVPLLQGEPYLDKPPLLYWCVMLSYRLFGTHDWAARLVPALAVHATILLTYFVGLRFLPERAAFWGGVFLSLAPGFLSVGRLLILDGLLALWTTLAVLAVFEAVRQGRLLWSWWLVAALACGLGVLTKGPIVLVLVLPPVLAFSWLNGRRLPVDWRHIGAFLAVVAVVTLPWYAAMAYRLPDFLYYFFWQHHVVRFLTPFDHQRPIWFYGPVMLFGLLPATLLLPAFVRFLVSNDGNRAAHRTPELGFLMLAGGWCVFFFSLSGCKLPTYVLPAYPPLALALGVLVTARSWERSRWLMVMTGSMALLLAVLHQVALPWYARFHSPMSRPEVVFRYCESTPVACYPRNCESAGFYLGREDLHLFRGKEAPELIEFCKTSPRTVILFMHRHSLQEIRRTLPPGLTLTDEVPLFDSAKANVEGVNHLLRSSLWDGSRDGSASQCFMAVVRRDVK
jgi:4-amino-4-deoxy-L-arabinose transferase-like glycosyltransferase